MARASRRRISLMSGRERTNSAPSKSTARSAHHRQECWWAGARSGDGTGAPVASGVGTLGSRVGVGAGPGFEVAHEASGSVPTRDRHVVFALPVPFAGAGVV